MMDLRTIGKEKETIGKVDLTKSHSYCSDNFDFLASLPEGCIDAHVTDEPYGISFMGKGWDKSVPSADLWREVYRVLKPGAFNMVLSSARQDVLARSIVNIEDAGFKVAFSSIYWTYATGFPKAMNMANKLHKKYTKQDPPGYAVDKRTGEEYSTTASVFSQDRKNDKREMKQNPFHSGKNMRKSPYAGDHDGEWDDAQIQNWRPIGHNDGYCPEAQPAIGAYGGYQPKPAVEAVIVAMKPISETSYIKQFEKNHKAVTWLGRCRVPDFEGSKGDEGGRDHSPKTFGGEVVGGWKTGARVPLVDGWFPANLLVDDKVIGRYSPYFSLTNWFKDRLKRLPPEQRASFPFLIVPKPTKKEKNDGLYKYNLVRKKKFDDGGGKMPKIKNFHPTVKPLMLMQYLVELASDLGDVVLDVFNGSGTTTVAAKLTGRVGIGCEKFPEYNAIANARMNFTHTVQKMDSFL